MFCNMLETPVQISHPGLYLFRGGWSSSAMPDVISDMEGSLKSRVTYRDEYNCVGPSCPEVFSTFADG